MNGCVQREGRAGNVFRPDSKRLSVRSSTPSSLSRGRHVRRAADTESALPRHDDSGAGRALTGVLKGELPLCLDLALASEAMRIVNPYRLLGRA